MTNSKWLRSALLGGVAVSVMATGAQASELSDLKAQLEALQSQVNTIQAAPRAALPEGAMLMTASRGQGSLANFGNEAAKDAANVSADRGFTISINPTADLPAPVTEITVYGYAKGVASWANETRGGTNVARLTMSAFHGVNEGSEWGITGRQTRFGIKAKTDTAIGQIRSVVEGDFASGANVLRLRHGYGEWDMTPNWTFVAGQTWAPNSLLPFGVSTVDFTGPAGPTYGRVGQVTLKYKNGPLSGAIGIMNPLTAGADYFDIGARMIYTAGGGHEFYVGASLGDDDTGATNRTSWQVGGGANLRLGEIATITAAVVYGKGAQPGNILTSQAFGTKDSNGNATKMWGAGVGVSMSVSEATTINAQVGYVDQAVGQGTASGSAGAATCSGTRSSACVDDLMTVHANILWRPVKQMRLGWEIAWGRNDYYAAKSNSVVKGLFGAWFFF